VVVATFWVLKFVVEVLGLCDEHVCCSCLNCCCCFYCYCHYTPFPLLAPMSSTPPTITIVTRNNNLFIVCCDLCSTRTRNSAWCKHSFYVWHLYLGCEYEPKIRRCSINSSIDQDSRNNGRRKCIKGGCSDNNNNNMRCQKFDDQHLHTLVIHQKEVLDNNAIWL
jgi:hypothetical protein